MKSRTKRLLTAGAMLVAAFMLAPAPLSTTAAFAAEIKYVVNGDPITTVDIQRRAAFLRLQQRSSKGAAEDMIEQALHLQEMKRLNVRITDAQVNDAYANFAKSNNLGVGQLDSILAQSGVTKDHFKEFIRTQMGWNQALASRARAEGTNEQDAVRRMLREGGTKPTANEYILQQVIFVVPERERRTLLAKRKREAQQVRDRYGNCETSRDLVRGMIDVTVRELGRILDPELPPDWAKEVKAAHAGNGVTVVRETPRGVEFIAICSSRVASDDRVAQLVFQQEQAKESGGLIEALSKKYTQELREKAQITTR
jgi:peptidyl-prolyl cis-trans isomerase SurA